MCGRAGIVLDVLNERLAGTELAFGPMPSTDSVRSGDL